MIGMPVEEFKDAILISSTCQNLAPEQQNANITISFVNDHADPKKLTSICLYDGKSHTLVAEIDLNSLAAVKAEYDVHSRLFKIVLTTMRRKEQNLIQRCIRVLNGRVTETIVLGSQVEATARDIYGNIIKHAFGSSRQQCMLSQRKTPWKTTSKIMGNNTRKLLVIISPVSGTGTSLDVWENILEPVLARSCLDYSNIITEYQGHATKVLRDMSGYSLAQLDTIVVLGGDGTVFEVIQGLRWHLESQNSPIQNLAIGLVPCGSGNGFSASLHVLAKEPVGDIESAVLGVMRGHRMKMDLWDVQYSTSSSSASCNSKKHSRLAFLSIAWGFVADVDIESERMRWLGWPRFYIGSALRVVGLRKYYARLSFTLSTDPSDLKLPLEDKVPSTWSSITGVFVWFWAVNGSHGAASMHVVPGARVDSGYIHISIIKDCSRFTLVPALLALESGSHRNHQICMELVVKGFRLEMLDQEGMPIPGLVSLDGEPVTCSCIQATCNPEYNVMAIVNDGGNEQNKLSC